MQVLVGDSMGRKRQVTHYDFESKTERGAFTKICNDMQESKAWKELKLRQQGLYLYLKSKFKKYSNQDTNQNDISIPKKEALTLYGDLRTFRDDIDELIDKGFIKQVVSGFNTRTTNIYGFSNLWKDYGKEDYKVPINDRRYIPKAYRKK